MVPKSLYERCGHPSDSARLHEPKITRCDSLFIHSRVQAKSSLRSPSLSKVQHERCLSSPGIFLLSACLWSLRKWNSRISVGQSSVMSDAIQACCPLSRALRDALKGTRITSSSLAHLRHSMRIMFTVRVWRILDRRVVALGWP